MNADPLSFIQAFSLPRNCASHRLQRVPPSLTQLLLDSPDENHLWNRPTSDEKFRQKFRRQHTSQLRISYRRSLISSTWRGSTRTWCTGTWKSPV